MINKIIFPARKIVLLGMLLILHSSCQNSNDPTIQILVFTTTAVSNITQTSVSSGGNISSDGGATITSRGVCWSTSQNPTITDTKTSDGAGSGSYTSNITGLMPNTVYFLRAYVEVGSSMGYGNEISFTTKKEIPTTVTDSDGNVYNTVTLAGKTWMKENLKTTKYKNATAIAFPNSNNAAWQTNTTGAYAWYNNDIANKNIYGALYNWQAVNTGNLCPTDWHVSTDAEWISLTDSLGGETIAGGKLKETGTTHWTTPNTGATNTTGFTALPGSSRPTDGSFSDFASSGLWWSVSEVSTTNVIFSALDYTEARVYSYNTNKLYGYSVRCVKD